MLRMLRSATKGNVLAASRPRRRDVTAPLLKAAFTNRCVVLGLGYRSIGAAVLPSEGDGARGVRLLGIPRASWTYEFYSFSPLVSRVRWGTLARVRDAELTVRALDRSFDGHLLSEAQQASVLIWGVWQWIIMLLNYSKYQGTSSMFQPFSSKYLQYNYSMKCLFEHCILMRATSSRSAKIELN